MQKNSVEIKFLSLLRAIFLDSTYKRKIIKDLIIFFILIVLQTGMAVWITKWSADLTNAIENRSSADIFIQAKILVILFFANIFVGTFHFVVKGRLSGILRQWLVKIVTAKWMNKGNHYLLALLSKPNCDNPDVRIAEDIRIAAEEGITLLHSLIFSLFLLGAFTKILWIISGKVVFDYGTFSIPVTGYLVWIALCYSTSAIILNNHISAPLTDATDIKQDEEANFRLELLIASQNSETIAMSRSDDKEYKRLNDAFRSVENTDNLSTTILKQIQIFSSGYSVISLSLPALVTAPRYLAGAISLGSLAQSVQAFQQVVAALTWPIHNISQIHKWRASAKRILEFIQVLDELEHETATFNSKKVNVITGNRSVLKFHNVVLADSEGKRISNNINTEIKAGERALIHGNSKTAEKLFQAIAGLWPWGSGEIETPVNEVLFFMPTIPYLPNSSLYESICYPEGIELICKSDLEKLVKRLALNDLILQLDRKENWKKILSREDQQRLGLVRVLMFRPNWIFIHDAFDAFSPEGERQMLEMLCKELPNATVLGITNQPENESFYQRKLKV